MATRSITVVDGIENEVLYRHWDGYPEHMVPHLTSFVEHLNGLTPMEKFEKLQELDDSFEPVPTESNLGQEWCYSITFDNKIEYENADPWAESNFDFILSSISPE